MENKKLNDELKNKINKLKNINNVFVHSSAFISDDAVIGENTKIWHLVQIREKAKIGKNCILGKNVYIDKNVIIGDNVKIQNNVSVFHGVFIEDGVFIGPHVCFTNDKYPRSINSDGTLKSENTWEITKTKVCKGSSIGANATIICGVNIGEWSMIGSGSVVTKDVPKHAIVIGNPAKVVGIACYCGHKMNKLKEEFNKIYFKCPYCNKEISFDKEEFIKNYGGLK